MEDCKTFKLLSEHRDTTISSLHLKDLLSDEDRSKALTFQHDGVYVDFSRQNATSETVKVRWWVHLIQMRGYQLIEMLICSC